MKVTANIVIVVTDSSRELFGAAVNTQPGRDASNAYELHSHTTTVGRSIATAQDIIRIVMMTFLSCLWYAKGQNTLQNLSKDTSPTVIHRRVNPQVPIKAMIWQPKRPRSHERAIAEMAICPVTNTDTIVFEIRIKMTMMTESSRAL